MDTQTGALAGPVSSSGGRDEQALSPVKRIWFLGVPLDIVPPEDLSETIDRLLPPGDGSRAAEPGKGQNIVLLSLWDLLRARRNKVYGDYVRGAALVLPISKSLVGGARFLTGTALVRYMPFNFAISLLSVLERREKSLFLLGGKSGTLKRAEKNLLSTFPGLTAVGRRAGAARRQQEPAVIEAIRKSSPSLLLAGKGVPGGELWIARNSTGLNSGFRLWCSDLFDVFAEKKRRPGDAIFEMGLECVGYCLRNPLKIFRIFPYFGYKFLLLYCKLFRK